MQLGSGVSSPYRLPAQVIYDVLTSTNPRIEADAECFNCLLEVRNPPTAFGTGLKGCAFFMRIFLPAVAA